LAVVAVVAVVALGFWFTGRNKNDKHAQIVLVCNSNNATLFRKTQKTLLIGHVEIWCGRRVADLHGFKSTRFSVGAFWGAAPGPNGFGT
jgi:hypothetical protein